MALEFAATHSTLWHEPRFLEPYPSESLLFSPCKISSSPRSSLDMILECEEAFPDVRLDGIPESEEQRQVAAAPATSAGRDPRTQGNTPSNKGTEEAFLEECFRALAQGGDWPKVRNRTEDLFDSRYSKDLASCKLRRTVSEPLPTIPEAEDTELCNDREGEGSSSSPPSDQERELCSKYMSSHPSKSSAPVCRFRPSLSTHFEVEEEFPELVPRQDPGQQNFKRAKLSAHFPSAVPLRLPAFFPGLPAVREGQGCQQHLTVYPWGLLLKRSRGEASRRHLRTVEEDEERITFTAVF